MSTLGYFIAALAVMPAGAPLTCGLGSPSKLSSYRGYYDHLAIEGGDKPITCGEFLAMAVAASGETFHGYKGGEYVMDDMTPLWVSAWGEVSDERYAGLAFDGQAVHILTEKTPW